MKTETAAAHAQRLAATVAEAQAEGQGLWAAEFYGRQEIELILARAADGDQKARALVTAFAELLWVINQGTAPRQKCLLCAVTFHPASQPAGVVFVRAAVDDPRCGLMSGVCEKCYDSHDSGAALREALVAAVSRHVLPGARRLSDPVAAGHA